MCIDFGSWVPDGVVCDVVNLKGIRVFVYPVSSLYQQAQHNFLFPTSLLLILLDVLGAQGVHHQAQYSFQEKV
jgi:hypothetical protein